MTERAAASDDTIPGWWRRWLAPALSVVVFGVVAALLHHVLGHYRLHDVIGAFRRIPRGALVAAAACTAGSYLMLTLYDVLAVRYVQKPVGYARTALTSFIAYAFGNNLSLAAFTE